MVTLSFRSSTTNSPPSYACMWKCPKSSLLRPSLQSALLLCPAARTAWPARLRFSELATLGLVVAPGVMGSGASVGTMKHRCAALSFLLSINVFLSACNSLLACPPACLPACLPDCLPVCLYAGMSACLSPWSPGRFWLIPCS